MILTALAALALTAAPAPVAQDPLSFDQTVSCAAMFFVQSKLLTAEDEVEAFQAGMVAMISRAEAMNPGLTQDQIIERAAGQADEMLVQIEGLSDADAKSQVVWTYGPGLETCIDAVLA